MKKRKLNEAEYNLTITDLNTTDGDTLSQIVAMANQADNGGMGEVAPEVAPTDPYEDGMVGDTAIDTPFDTMGSDDMGMEELPAEAPVEEPMTDDMGMEDTDFAPDGVEFSGEEDLGADEFEPEMEENNFNEEEPYTHPCAHAESGNLLTEDESKNGYSVMVKDKEYAHIDTDKEYSDDEIINEFLKQYMEKTGKEFPYIDQIVIKHSGGDVEEDVLLPKDDDNEFIPEEENWMMEDDEESPLTDDQINEEINSIMWSAGCKGCSKKEEKGVNTKSLMEDDEVVDEAKATWKPSDENPNVNAMSYLDDDVKQVYELYQTGDYSDKEIFDMLQDAGCSYQRARQIFQDWIAEKHLGESENPEMNMEDCDAPNPAEMNLDDEEDVEESAYSPKLKDPNRKKPTQANYQDVNINADAKSGTLGFEYPASTSGKISLSPKAGKIMETAKHLISNANGNKKEKLQSRFVFKLMNEGVSYSDAKKIVSRF